MGDVTDRIKYWMYKRALNKALKKEKKQMKKWLNELLAILPFNGQKLNIGVGLLGLITLLSHLKIAIPSPELVATIDAVIIILGAIHKLVK